MRKNMKRNNKNKMTPKAFWFGVYLIICTLPAKTQCNHRLVEIAAEMAGADAIYIREFKVKLSKGTMDEPSPTGKFPVYLNKGIQYRFTVANAQEYQGKAIVEITRRGQQYAGNYDFENNSYASSFEFLCYKSATYQLLINYGADKEGCSAIVMNMVVQDSLEYIDPSIPYKSDSAEVLYMWIENELQIASSEGKGANLEVTVSQGKVEERPGYFIIHPEKPGKAVVQVNVIRNNKIVDSDSVIYFIEYPPLPTIDIDAVVGSQLSLRDFTTNTKVNIIPPFDSKNPYLLKEFSLVHENNMLETYRSEGDQLSLEQINFIRKLSPGDKIYIVKALFTDPEGKTKESVKTEITIVE
jgi:hypothetical protein